jgi:L,D-transpeptidase ErfK/SrfK
MAKAGNPYARFLMIRAVIAITLVAILAACANLPGLATRTLPASTASLSTSMFPLTPETDVVGRVYVVIARHEDTFSDIARRFDVGYEEMVAANPGVNPWVPGKGTHIVLPTQYVLPAAPRKGIVLNVATMRLFYYPASSPGETPIVITHPVGIGRENWATPLGVTRVVSKVANPAWHVPPSIRAEHAREGERLPAVVPPGPNNPLGKFALRLGIPGYLIHGTNKPQGIGMRVSHGCVQLYPEDIASLFTDVPVGTSVRIVDQPYLAGWLNGRLYLDAHPPLQSQDRAARKNLRKGSRLLVSSGHHTVKNSRKDIDWTKVKQVMKEARGVPVPLAPGSPDLEALLAAAPVLNRRPPSSATEENGERRLSESALIRYVQADAAPD